MKRFRGKILVLAAIFIMAFSCLTGFAAEGSGSFCFTASTSQEVLVSPRRISYEGNETIIEALTAAGINLNYEGSFLQIVEGTVGNYTLLYDGGGYDLNERASQITALCISENTNVSDSTLDLLKYIIEVDERSDNVKNDEKVQKAYRNALDALTYANSDTAKKYQEELETAVGAYDALFAGEKYTVTLTAAQNGTEIANPAVRLTDRFGNVTEGINSVSVIAGEYTYSVSDGTFYRTEGTVTVTEDVTVSAELPYGEWFGDVKLLNQKQNKEPFSYEPDPQNHRGVYYIPDYVKYTGVILNAGINRDGIPKTASGEPDTENVKLYAVYTSFYGDKDRNFQRSWESTGSTVTGVVTEGTEGNILTLEARYEVSEGVTQIETYTVDIRKIPTLTGLTVTAEGTVLRLDFNPGTFTYEVNTVSDSMTLEAVPFGEDYTVSGTGLVQVTDGASCKVTVEGGAYSSVYTVKAIRKDYSTVTLSVPAGVTAEVRNAAGSLIAPVSDNTWHLIPGEEYIATGISGRYCADTAFTAPAGQGTVSVPEPRKEEALSDFCFYDMSSAKKASRYETNVPFHPDTDSYVITVSDGATALYVQADPQNNYTVRVMYERQSSNSDQGKDELVTEIKSVNATGSATNLPDAIESSGYSNLLTIRAEKNVGSTKYYQDYKVLVTKKLHLKALSLSNGEYPVTLMDAEEKAVSFDRDVQNYVIGIENTVTELALTGTFPNEGDSFACDGGYSLSVGEENYEDLSDVKIPLDSEKQTETVILTVNHADDSSVSTDYTLQFMKKEPVQVTFSVTPEDALCFVLNNRTGDRVVPGEDGTFTLVPGVSYNYSVTRNGYQGVQNTDYVAPDEASEIEIVLAVAEESDSIPDYDAFWPAFRADPYNNGVIDAPTGTAKDNVVLNWATKLGDGYSSDACGCPILVNGYLYTYARNRIYKVDTVTGEVLKEGEMDHSSSFAINNPTYAEGMIFVGLSDGTVQAFNADTLESLWIYHDALKGQPNCPIVYKDGYIYTGFWLGETSKANFVALSITDEDPSQSMEEKIASWIYTSKGGFYWAGAYAGDDWLVVGTDDGASGYLTGHASILSFDRRTGTVIDKITLKEVGDIRSSVSFVPDSDAISGNCYFTTKGGYFYRVHIDKDGKFDSELKALKLGNYADDPQNPAMSTCTPVIYNERAYVGISGTSQFGAYSGHNITVIDLENFRIAYSVRTMGYPQTSGLLTTHYEESTGKVNVYFYDNFTPGVLRMLTDCPGQTEPDVTEVETYNMSGTVTNFDTAYVLFTPYAEQAQYAICSPIVDEYGTIYFKNDSAYLMALGSRIEKLEITKQPDVTSYLAGDKFDPKGMEVTAHYANGTTRDVTQYVEWSEEALNEEDTEFQIFYPYAMYADSANGVNAPGTKVDKPFAVLNLSFGADVMIGDVNDDKVVNAADAALAYSFAKGKYEPTETQKIAGDVNGDNKITANDAAIIYSYAKGKINEFPADKKEEIKETPVEETGNENEEQSETNQN